MLVPQARCRSMPGVRIVRPESITLSRARFQSRECLMTAPRATSPMVWPRRSSFVTSPCRAAVMRSWLVHLRYTECERQKGMREPPTTATRTDRPSCSIMPPEREFHTNAKQLYTIDRVERRSAPIIFRWQKKLLRFPISWPGLPGSHGRYRCSKKSDVSAARPRRY